MPHCDHKFVDSKCCLKCGWDPGSNVATLRARRVPRFSEAAIDAGVAALQASLRAVVLDPEPLPVSPPVKVTIGEPAAVISQQSVDEFLNGIRYCNECTQADLLEVLAENPHLIGAFHCGAYRDPDIAETLIRAIETSPGGQETDPDHANA